MKRIEEVEDYYPVEIEWRLHANELKTNDRLAEMHLSAWLNQAVKATKTKGTGKSKRYEPIYGTFDKFYNAEEIERSINEKYWGKTERELIKDNRENELKKLMLRANKLES